MGFFGKYFSGLGRKTRSEKQNGDMRKASGAGPALAAPSKDAKTTGATGQGSAPARKKSDK